MAAFLNDPLDFFIQGINPQLLVLTAWHPVSGLSTTLYDGPNGGWQGTANGTIVGSGDGGITLSVTSGIPTTLPLGVWYIRVVAYAYGGAPAGSATWWFLLVTNWALVSGFQSTLNSVDLVFDAEPSHLDPSDPSDATNIAAYTVTGPGPPFADRLLQSIVYQGDNTLRLYFDGDLVPDQPYTISVTGIVSSTGDILLPDPAVASFTAFGADRAPISLVEQPTLHFDIRNPQADRDAPASEPLGTFIIDDKGDVDIESGRQYLRKRVFRRLTTRKGAFFHEPDYGIEYDDKKLTTPTRLRALQQDIEMQLRREQDVVTARATLSVLVPGVVLVRIVVRDRFGEFNIDTTIGGS
jgi:hypothetical protein